MRGRGKKAEEAKVAAEWHDTPEGMTNGKLTWRWHNFWTEHLEVHDQELAAELDLAVATFIAGGDWQPLEEFFWRESPGSIAGGAQRLTLAPSSGGSIIRQCSAHDHPAWDYYPPLPPKG